MSLARSSAPAPGARSAPWFVLLLWLPGAGVSAAPRSLREEVLVRLPVGPGPAAISDDECVARTPHCAAGLAVLSPKDSLYLYDLGNDNVKVIALHPAGLVRLAPGLGSARGLDEIPLAGDASANGTLRLLVGVPGSRAPRAMWVLRAGSGEWRRAPAAATEAAPAEFGMPALPTIPGIPKRAVAIGRDGAGNWFVETRPSWSTQVLAKHGPDGRLLAEVALPERPIWKPLIGPTDKWVTSQGKVIEVYVGPRWLVVASWEEGP